MDENEEIIIEEIEQDDISDEDRMLENDITPSKNNENDEDDENQKLDNSQQKILIIQEGKNSPIDLERNKILEDNKNQNNINEIKKDKDDKEDEDDKKENIILDRFNDSEDENDKNDKLEENREKNENNKKEKNENNGNKEKQIIINIKEEEIKEIRKHK